VRACLGALGTQLLSLKKQILELDRMIMAWYRSNETSRRLHYMPVSVHRWWKPLWWRGT
jgi:transposase